MNNKFKMDSLVVYKDTVYKVFSAEQEDNGPIYYNLFPIIPEANPSKAICVGEINLKKWNGKVTSPIK